MIAIIALIHGTPGQVAKIETTRSQFSLESSASQNRTAEIAEM